MRTTLITLLVFAAITTHAQQEDYTLLLMEFENQSGIDNPLLNSFNDTMSFVLSRQAEGVQVRVIPSTDRDALLARAASESPDATPLDQALLAAELVDADALVTGSYTKQGDVWSMDAQVYHRKGTSKARQEIAIQDEAVYGLLDAFPAQLLPQFTGAGSVAITTDSWKAYEEFRKGHEQFEGYNFFGALEHYDRALALDPTLALAYAEQSYVYFMTGQPELATKAIQTAQEWLPSASMMEQLAIRVLDYGWDSEKNAYREGLVNLAPSGIWDEALVHGTMALICAQQGDQEEVNQHNDLWFQAIRQRLLLRPDDGELLHQAAQRCLEIGRYTREAMDMAEQAINLMSEEEATHWQGPRAILSRLCMQQGNVELALKWAAEHIQNLPDPRPIVREGTYGINYDSMNDFLSDYVNQGDVAPDRLQRWCQQIIQTPSVHEPLRISTQYLEAQCYQKMGDAAAVDAILVSLGSPHESVWMVIGPFDTDAENPFPNEAPLTLCEQLDEPRQGLLGREILWHPLDDALDGTVSVGSGFAEMYPNLVERVVDPFMRLPVPSIAYSCIYAYIPDSMTVQIRLGASYMRLWLNDNPSPVITVDTSQKTVHDCELKEVALDAGFNRILIATIWGTYSFGFKFRITDLDGNAIPGLKYVSMKDVLARQ